MMSQKLSIKLVIKIDTFKKSIARVKIELLSKCSFNKTQQCLLDILISAQKSSVDLLISFYKLKWRD